MGAKSVLIIAIRFGKSRLGNKPEILDFTVSRSRDLVLTPPQLSMPQSEEIIVIKFGSGILTHPDGIALDDTQFDGLVNAVAKIHKVGKRPVIVSSGAAAAGMMAFGIKERPKDLSELQACCAVGQTRLMHFYETLFRQYDLNVAQLLLTNEDFSTPSRTSNVINTFDELLKHDNVIPIINENDSVATEELKFGDNDSLSASLSIMINASLLIILTEVDGLMDSDGNIIPVIHDIKEALNHVRSEKGTYSVGGMATKLEAASLASRSGIPTMIANGRKIDQIERLINEEGVFTKISIGNE